jgi:hypothetical protein
MDIFDSHFHQFRDMPLAAMIFSSAILEPAPANSTDKLGAYLRRPWKTQAIHGTMAL